MNPSDDPVQRPVRPWFTRIPYDRACDLAGGEAALTHDEQGRKYKGPRISNWKRFGVPAQHVYTKLILRMERGDLTDPLGSVLLSSKGAQVVRQIRELWERTHGETAEWAALEALLKAILRQSGESPGEFPT